MTIANTLEHFLRERGVEYDLVPHERKFTSDEKAQSAHVPGNRFAKAVILSDEQGYLVAVLPSTHRLELGLLHRRLARQLGLASEKEVRELFPDCVLGAVPPTGEAYGLPTIVDECLTGQEEVFFEAGDLEELVRVRGAQFGDLMQHAERARISTHS